MNRKVLVPVVAAAIVTATIIFGITRLEAENSNKSLVGLKSVLLMQNKQLSSLINAVTGQYLR